MSAPVLLDPVPRTPSFPAASLRRAATAYAVVASTVAKHRAQRGIGSSQLGQSVVRAAAAAPVLPSAPPRRDFIGEGRRPWRLLNTARAVRGIRGTESGCEHRAQRMYICGSVGASREERKLRPAGEDGMKRVISERALEASAARDCEVARASSDLDTSSRARSVHIRHWFSSILYVSIHWPSLVKGAAAPRAITPRCPPPVRPCVERRPATP